MNQNLTRKIIAAHLVVGEMIAGQEIAIRIDRTLTQDATGTMAWLQFEAMGLPRVRAECAVSVVDHNMLQSDYRNADDHRYLQSAAARYGAWFSRPGNGICHQVMLERFGAPGCTLLGSDSHTPNAGGVGMLAIGAGGLDVAVAMGGGPFYLAMPQVLGVRLIGQLSPWVSAKDVILEMLRRLTVKGGVNKVIEYLGPGVSTLTVSQRATICNMGAELGATSSVFASDEQTRLFLQAQNRVQDWLPLAADEGAEYDEMIELDLSELEPLIAQPSSPDRVVPVQNVAGIPVDQVCVGACTNSSFDDLMIVAAILKGKTVHPRVSLTVTPGSRQVLQMIAENGALADLIAAGARVLEAACGPCVGMGQAPATGAVSLRSFNRNFEGRSGTPNDQVYLCSPAVCAAAALTGRITDPRSLAQPAPLIQPAVPACDDAMILPPADNLDQVQVVMGPNIKPVPQGRPLPERLAGRVLIRVGDHITTDHIMPAGAKVLPYRSNIPAMSDFVFERVDASFAQRAREWGDGIIVGGANYGQGSSREHAALAPMYLGVRAVIVKSFARIHRANLINVGILPLILVRQDDYEGLEQGDELEITGLDTGLAGGETLWVKNPSKGTMFEVKHNLTPRQARIVLAGGLLNYIRDGGQ